MSDGLTRRDVLRWAAATGALAAVGLRASSRSGADVLATSAPVINGIFTDDATTLTRVSSAELQANHYAAKLANQLLYATPVSEAGAFFGYSGMGYGGKPRSRNTRIHFTAWNAPLWVVAESQPRVKMYFVHEEGRSGGPEETLDTAKQERLGPGWLHVPVPTRALMLSRRRRYPLGAFGSDGWGTIWCPETDELWEYHRGGFFAAGPYAGSPKCGNGHYQTGVSKWSGVTAAGTGVGIAAGIACVGGMITISDIVRVLRGGKIGHALSLTGLPVVQNTMLAPARSHDSQPNRAPYLEDEKTPNPAYWTTGQKEPGATPTVGWADAVPEGAWFAFPANSPASAHGLTEPFDVAFYEAIREHGVVVAARGGGCGFGATDPATLFTPYCDAKVNPFHGDWVFDRYVDEGTTEALRATWTDPTLPRLGIAVHGSDVVSKMPWRTLQQLAPRTT